MPGGNRALSGEGGVDKGALVWETGLLARLSPIKEPCDPGQVTNCPGPHFTCLKMKTGQMLHRYVPAPAVEDPTVQRSFGL